MVALALCTDARAQPEPKEPTGQTEIDFVPVLGGSSDIGFGGGAVGAITRFVPGEQESREKWAWRLETSALVTFRALPSFGVPYQDEWLLLTLPDLYRGKLRLTARAAFTKETMIRYFGLGDATSAPLDDSSPRYIYGRTHPTLEGHARALLAPHLFATAGLSFTLNWLDMPQEGPLAIDMRYGTPEVRALLGDARTHLVGLVDASASWDTRDDEVVPRRGTWHEVNVRASPALGYAMPYEYIEVIAIARTYVPVGSRVVIGLRGLGDALAGSPPFYQLAEYDDTYAIGGSAGVRGVPAARYYGKAKLLSNLEVRTDVMQFRALSKPWAIALVGFFDAGRLWADWSAHPDLDGNGLGLKWGTGLGIRVQQGRAFVVRADLAWSPDAEPIGGYFAAGEAF